MAINFQAYPSSSYQGTLTGVNTAVCTPPKSVPRVVPLYIDWLTYGASSSKPNVGINFDLTQNATNPLDQIRSVYIDNSSSPVPIYVVFPDTRYVVTAPPNSIAWYPAITNIFNGTIYGTGFATGLIPKTTVMFSNIVQSYTDVEIPQAMTLFKASPSISRGLNLYNSNFGAPSLGDQVQTADIDIGLATPVVLMNSPRTSGFFYIKAWEYNIIRAASAAGIQVSSTRFLSLGVSGNIATFSYFLNSTTPVFGATNISRMQGMDIKLDATEQWVLLSNNSNTVGLGQFELCYTYNPF